MIILGFKQAQLPAQWFKFKGPDLFFCSQAVMPVLLSLFQLVRWPIPTWVAMGTCSRGAAWLKQPEGDGNL